MKIDAELSISNPSSGGVNIRIYDVASHAEFVDLTISHEEFSRALGHLSARPCTAEVRGLAYVGKWRITESRETLAPDLGYGRDKYVDWLAALPQKDGWTANCSLGSQGSMTRQSDGVLLRYTVSKYVDEKPEEAP